MIRYYQYDFDKGIITEYARRGQCLRCGDCCRAEITFEWAGDKVRGNGKNGGCAVDGRDLWQVVEDEEELRCYKVTGFIGWNMRCGSLGDGNLCIEHDKPPSRHGICQDWPMGPKCNEDLPTCGFTFETIGNWHLLPGNVIGDAIPMLPTIKAVS